MEKALSTYLSDLINFLDNTETWLHMAEQDLEEANIDLQDLQHFNEFGKADAVTMVKIYKLNRQTRLRRRKAKEDIEQLSPIVEWYGRHRQDIQELRAVLGSVRKIERNLEFRSYAIRGHILDDITTLTHLTSSNPDEDLG